MGALQPESGCPAQFELYVLGCGHNVGDPFSGTTTMKGPVHNSQTEAYLRVASIAVALYEFCINSIWLKNLGTDAMLTYSYVLTLPVEWRFYSSQSSIMRPRCVNGH